MERFIRALRHRHFRLYFSGQVVSLIGTWTQQVAMAWLVYRMTGSPMLLGLIGFAGQIPIFIFAPFGGLWSDRFNRRSLLIVTQTLAMIQAFVLAALVFSGWVQVWHLILMAISLGVIHALDAPARQAIVVQLVADRKDLSNAIALNSFAINSARLIGPTFAGVLVTLYGEAVCFLLNGLSYLAVLVALHMMRIQDSPRQRHTLIDGFKQGVAYAYHFAPVRTLLVLVATVSFSVTPYVVLMPVYAKHTFNGNAQTLGWLLASAGLGALLATIYLAYRRTIIGLGNVIIGGALAAGLGLIVFSYSEIFWVSVLALIVLGFGVISVAASSNIVIQTIVPDTLRGRVMSLYTMSFLGVAPLGALVAGTVANYLGAPATLFTGGIVTTIAAYFFARQLPGLRKLVRPIYVEQGILSETE